MSDVKKKGARKTVSPGSGGKRSARTTATRRSEAAKPVRKGAGKADDAVLVPGRPLPEVSGKRCTPTPEEVAQYMAQHRQEVGFKEPREGTRVMSADEANRVWSDIHDRHANGEREGGHRSHKIGSSLNLLYSQWAEVSLGYSSFAEMCDARFPFGKSTAYGCMRLCDATSHEKAGEYGLTRAMLGLQLLPLMGVESLEALERRDLPLEKAPGVPWRFPATRQALRQAMKILTDGANARPAKLAPKLRQRVQALETVIDAESKKSRVLAEVSPRVYVHGRELKFRTAPFGARHLAALRRLLLALEKADSKFSSRLESD